ncbi:auxin response factor 3 [Prunus yedoensis var. nudiflora]|uniref:Auxin response factor 3 n=1 Tax=Prunus yedoensis var. nudiflora TaxID=2094558 RepID=A0A314YEN9_PRUYE|nr:auxin response factor 3 [Prunus yedoensis var. nudiflora]
MACCTSTELQEGIKALELLKNVYTIIKVRWDDIDTSKQGRVSPWEIEPSGSVSSSHSLMAAGLKRARSGLSAAKTEFLVPNVIGASDWGESLRFQKVSQGQEILGFDNHFEGLGGQNQHPSEPRRGFHGSSGPGIAAGAGGNGLRKSLADSEILNRHRLWGIIPIP